MRLTEVQRGTVRVTDGALDLGARMLPRRMRALADEATALAVGFNPRRIDRYLALVRAGAGGDERVQPVVVLTVADVAAHTPGLIAERVVGLQGRVPAAFDLLIVDGADPHTAQRLAPHLAAEQTLVALGSSGAGRSTLTNTLLGRAVQDTGAEREHDSRGKHTTTACSLHRLQGRACVIDTPGLRALRPDVDDVATLIANSPTSRPWARGAAFATADIMTNRAVRCARASKQIVCATTTRCCATRGETHWVFSNAICSCGCGRRAST
jgi:hypothetical protein